jgi:hypothetical protein
MKTSTKEVNNKTQSFLLKKWCLSRDSSVYVHRRAAKRWHCAAVLNARCICRKTCAVTMHKYLYIYISDASDVFDSDYDSEMFDEDNGVRNVRRYMD